MNDIFVFKGTIIFSIHQPRYSIFKLFDTLFLIAAGHCVYHGPARDVLQFFSSIDFTCEEHNNPADFILDILQENRLSSLNNLQDKIECYLNDAYKKTTIYNLIGIPIAAGINSLLLRNKSLINLFIKVFFFPPVFN